MVKISPKETQLLQIINKDIESLFSPYACKNEYYIREYSSKYDEKIIRSQYAVDIDKILHSALFNRESDKTQVFSFYRNDDITRRAYHVQLVSRIGRTIGKALRLNLDLIEAIAIGHDVGHTPFGHKGEQFLNELYSSNTGRFFNHNVHSVRVLQKISGCNLTLQTLDGILCHCGEKAFEKYEPSSLSNFDEFNAIIEECYTQKERIKTLRPSTLEGCVVRISDMIAYIGKDRQDAAKAKITTNFKPNKLGDKNPEIITTIIEDIIVNSLEKTYVSMSKETFEAITETLEENNEQIYQCKDVTEPYYNVIKPMMEILYNRFKEDFTKDRYDSLIYQHYLNGWITGNYYRHHSKRFIDKMVHTPDDVVVDFIASMTDDYFIEVFKYLYPDDGLNKQIRYIEYFDSRYTNV